jgi:anti-anti-sigma factor
MHGSHDTVAEPIDGWLIEVTRHDGRAVVQVCGELDLNTAPQLRDALTELLDGGATELIVDLSGVSFLDSSGINVLIRAAKRLSDGGGTLRLRSPSSQARNVLEMTGLLEAMPVE